MRLVLLLALLLPATAHAQLLDAERTGIPGHTEGTITSAQLTVSLTSEDDEPVDSALVRIAGTTIGAMSKRDGVATLSGVPAGRHRLIVSGQQGISAEGVVRVHQRQERLHVQLRVGTRAGTLFGYVTDDSGETLPGAAVFLPEIQRGAATGLNGEFLISNIPLGVYDVQFASVGLQAKTARGVEVGKQAVQLTAALEVGKVSYDRCYHCIERPIILTDMSVPWIIEGDDLENRPDRYGSGFSLTTVYSR